MTIDIISKTDLAEFRQLLIEDLKDILDFAYTRTKWIRISEAKELLSCSAATIKNLRINKHLPYTKLGGSYFYPRHEIEKILDEGKNISAQISSNNDNIKAVHPTEDCNR